MLKKKLTEAQLKARQYAAHKRWRKNNPEKFMAYVKRWRAENAEWVKKYNKAWRKNNPDKIKKYNKRAALKQKK